MAQNLGSWNAFRDSEIVQPEPTHSETPPHFPGPDKLIELSNWWVIADYPVSAHCSGRKLSGPDLPGVPGASGSYFSLCRWEDARGGSGAAIILSPTQLDTPSQMSSGQGLHNPNSQRHQIRGRGVTYAIFPWGSLKNKSSVLFYCGKNKTTLLKF